MASTDASGAATIRAMAVWRCPHCATPQSEAARCWVCHRSTTSCGTCRHFRRSIASGLGVCGLDPRHVALTGGEMRACWTPPDALLEDDEAPRRIPVAAAPADPGGRVPRTFVPVEELVLATPSPRPTAAAATAPAPSTDAVIAPGWSLWGEPER
jgi:hypothetical protein